MRSVRSMAENFNNSFRKDVMAIIDGGFETRSLQINLEGEFVVQQKLDVEESSPYARHSSQPSFTFTMLFLMIELGCGVDPLNVAIFDF